MRIGRYETERELGRGAMGVVFAARDGDGRPVAVKLLLPGAATRERRFEREVEALLRLRHDNVVRLLDAGQHQSFPYLVTELIEGETLDDRLARQGPLEPRAAAEIARDVARGVAHAHDNEVLHRDLKPSNVLVEAGGRARVVDFGLARDALTPGSLTRSGQLLGTPGFWSPEQARGKRHLVGKATDVYGVGATLYAALTGDPPARGGTIAELLVATCDTPAPPPSSVRPGIDRDLEALCLRCLEKDPADRFESAAALADALDRWLAGGGVARSPAGAQRLAVLALAGAAAVVVLLAGAIAILAAPVGPPPPPAVAPPPPSTTTTPEVDARAASVAAATSRGFAHLRDDDLLAAFAAFGEALARDPEHVPALLGRARAHWASRDGPRAKEDVARALALAPDDPDALVARGDFRRGSEDDAGDPAAALADYERALELDPDHAGAYEGRGTVREDFDDAVADYTRAIELGGGRATTFANRAMARALLYREREDPELLALAIEDLGRAIDLEPDDAYTLIERARLYRERGEPRAALADLDRALGLEETSDALVARARLRRDLARGPDEHAQAYADLRRATEVDPRNPGPWYFLGELATADRELTEAETAYTRVIELDPDGPGWAARGRVRLLRNDLVNARADLDQAVNRNPDDPQARYDRGKALMALQDFAGAIDDFDRVSRLQPEDPWAPMEKGNALLAAGDAPAALAEYERALRRAPRFGPAFLGRGRVKQARGDLAGAIADWREALRTIPPDQPDAEEAARLLREAGAGP